MATEFAPINFTSCKKKDFRDKFQEKIKIENLEAEKSILFIEKINESIQE